MKLGLGGFLAALAFALVFASSAAAASFDAHGSAEQVYATGLPKDASVSLLDSAGAVVSTRQSNFLGGALWRNVTPGDGYRVRLDTTGESSGPLTVDPADLTDAAPKHAYTHATVPSDGYGYMSMRDGTKLAYSVHPPTDVLNALGGNLPEGVTSQILDHTPSP